MSEVEISDLFEVPSPVDESILSSSVVLSSSDSSNSIELITSTTSSSHHHPQSDEKDVIFPAGLIYARGQTNVLPDPHCLPNLSPSLIPSREIISRASHRSTTTLFSVSRPRRSEPDHQPTRALQNAIHRIHPLLITNHSSVIDLPISPMRDKFRCFSMIKYAHPLSSIHIPHRPYSPLLLTQDGKLHLKRPTTAPATLCFIRPVSPRTTTSEVKPSSPVATPNFRISDLSTCSTILATSSPRCNTDLSAPSPESGIHQDFTVDSKDSSPFAVCGLHIITPPTIAPKYLASEVEKSSWDSDDTDNEDDGHEPITAFKSGEAWPRFTRPTMYVIRKTLRTHFSGNPEDEAIRKTKKNKKKKNHSRIWHEAVRTSAKNTQKMTHALRDILGI